MKTTPSFTIIIPHYNIPRLLRHCLASIPKRDDIQVIVVDDKSNELCRKQLRELEKDFPAVSFLYAEEHRGGGRARNLGMEQARGKFLLFADADDFFNDCIGGILEDYSTSEDDLIFFNANSVYLDDFRPARRSFQLNRIFARYPLDRKKGETCLRFLFGEPWCKLIRRDLVEKNHIRFEETPIHNDTRFSYMVGYYAGSIAVDDRVLYCVTERTGSVSKAKDTDIELIRTRIFATKNRFLADHHIHAFDEILLWPFKDAVKQHDWKLMHQYFAVARQYGYSLADILFRYSERKLFHKNNTNWCHA